jgi:hypothetical protein
MWCDNLIKTTKLLQETNQDFNMKLGIEYRSLLYIVENPNMNWDSMFCIL